MFNSTFLQLQPLRNDWNMEPKEVLFSSMLLLLLLPFSSGNIEIITSEQSLSDGVLLLSKGSSFALGFFSPPNSSYKYVGVWYFKLPNKTVVWVANRDAPINDSSGVLSINAYGNLVLNDRSRHAPLWSTSDLAAPTNRSRVAELLDTGNLVLRDDDTKGVVWQSFDYPSDSMLPGMKLGADLKHGLNWSLTSWKSPSDPGIGEYCHKLDSRGFTQFFLYRGLTPIWRSPGSMGVGWNEITKATSTFFYNSSFVYSEDEIYFTFTLSDPSIITRTVVTNNGQLQRLTWHDIDREWKAVFSAPDHNCDEYRHCGAYGICNTYDVDSFECGCLPGFQPRSPKDWYLKDGSGGCVKKRPANSCGVGEGFLKVGNVKIPDTSRPRVDRGLNLKACKEVCLRECSCTAYTNLGEKGADSVCLTLYGELIDTVEYTDSGTDLYVRVDAIELENARKSKGFLKRKGMLLILTFSSAGALFLLVIFSYLYLMKKRKARDSLLEKDELEESGRHPDLPFLRLSTIVAATNNFSSLNKLGQGGFGSVYKGQLSNGQVIAVKRLSKSSGQGIKEFKNEVTLIAKLQHRNLVKLLGSCIQGEEKMLIYEYMPNKSLDCFIFNQTRRSLLDWGKRYAIIVGIARGILYLHQDSRLRIIHRDLKTSNVLLDAEMNPKISDFGMARIFKGDQVQDKTQRVVGTYGYMSPEYAIFGKFSTKSDVFSFGIILLEIISGKKNTYYFYGEPSLTLIGHVWDLWREGKALEILDSSLKESHLPHEVLRCIHIGLLCVEESVVDRPTMLQVVLMLVGEATLPPPKQPAFVFRRTCNGLDASTTGRGPLSINEVTITRVEAR